MIRCLFEQSGTFKRAAMRLGYEAEDYDILNNFGETDHQIDLFNEISKAYLQEKSIFDEFSKDDIIFAFFPCVRFSKWMLLHLNGTAYNTKKLDEKGKIEYFMRIESSRSEMAQLFSKMVIVCLQRGLKLIVENPDDPNHYLIKYFPVLPKVRISDRSEYGDKFRKPTAFWFFNIEPKDNFFLEDMSFQGARERVNDYQTKDRSLMTPQFAYNFLKIFIGENNNDR